LIGIEVNAYTVINTFENPNNVSIKEFIAAEKGNILTHRFPAFLITAIKIIGKLKETVQMGKWPLECRIVNGPTLLFHLNYLT